MKRGTTERGNTGLTASLLSPCREKNQRIQLSDNPKAESKSYLFKCRLCSSYLSILSFQQECAPQILCVKNKNIQAFFNLRHYRYLSRHKNYQILYRGRGCFAMPEAATACTRCLCRVRGTLLFPYLFIASTTLLWRTAQLPSKK